MKPVNFGYHAAGTRQCDSFGSRLRAARIHAGMSIKDSALRGGISVSALSRAERQMTHMMASPHPITELAKLYGVPAVWLYAGDLAGKRLTPDWYSPQPV